MTRTGSTLTARRLAGLAAAVALLAATATGCAEPGAAARAPVEPSTTSAAGQRIVLRFDQVVVPATLSDTAAGREFATLLPVIVELRDPMGQAKSGRLPVRLNASDARITDPEAGGLYYVPESDLVAVYDDLGQTVPLPGLTRLGSVDGDLTEIAGAGNRVRVRIDLADAGT